MLAHLGLLLLSAGLAVASPGGPPRLTAAPELVERAAIAAPSGGWWTEEGLYARVHAAPEDRAVARRLAQHAAESVPALAERLGVVAGAAVDVYVAPTQIDFERLQPGAPPDWADGTAWPLQGLVFLRSPSIRPGTAEPLEQVLDHELVHVLVGRAFAPRRPPRWLQEGLAQWYSGETGGAPGVIAESGRLLPLSELISGFPSDPVRAREAYAASADFIGFVADGWGEEAVRGVIARMAEGDDVRDALAGATGVPFARLEARWRTDWDDPLWWSRAVAMGETVLWSGLAAAVAVGAVMKRVRVRRGLERLERLERLEDVAAAARREAAAMTHGDTYHRPVWA